MATLVNSGRSFRGSTGTPDAASLLACCPARTKKWIFLRRDAVNVLILAVNQRTNRVKGFKTREIRK